MRRLPLLYTRKLTKAHKEHQCDWCGEWVGPGTQYVRENGRCSHYWTRAWHLECFRVAPMKPRHNNTSWRGHTKHGMIRGERAKKFNHSKQKG